MKSTAKSVLTILVTAFVAIALAACAPKPTVENADRWANHVVKKMDREYLLSTEQKTLLYSAYEDYRDDVELRSEHVEIIDAWIAEIRKPKINEADLISLMERERQLDLQNQEKNAAWLKELHTTMNDEQKTKLIGKLDKLSAWIGVGFF